MMTEDEQAFWDRAFCAALGGLCATTYKPGDLTARAATHADAALSARRLRTEKDKP